MAEAFDGVVVEIDVVDFDIGGEGVGVDSVAVVLGGDVDAAGGVIAYRVVAAAVSEL